MKRLKGGFLEMIRQLKKELKQADSKIGKLAIENHALKERIKELEE